jgi:hypothetical protein
MGTVVDYWRRGGGGCLVGRWNVKGYRIQVILQDKMDLEVKQQA